MRKLILASAVALVASLPLGMSTASADVVVRFGNNGYHHHQRHHYRHHHRRHHVRHCFKKRTVFYHHGRKVVRVERVCR